MWLCHEHYNSIFYDTNNRAYIYIFSRGFFSDFSCISSLHCRIPSMQSFLSMQQTCILHGGRKWERGKKQSTFPQKSTWDVTIAMSCTSGQQSEPIKMLLAVMATQLMHLDTQLLHGDFCTSLNTKYYYIYTKLVDIFILIWDV